MHTDTLMTALYEWTGPARDRLAIDDPEARPPWIIACWEDADSTAAVSVLASATAALHHGYDKTDWHSAMPLPDGWLEAAVSSDTHMRDLTTGPTRYLAGVGLLTSEITGDGHWGMRARIAMNDGAFVYEHRDDGPHTARTEARLRIGLGDPIWWDEQSMLEPLERYRSTVTGGQPHLPETDREPVLAWPSSSAGWPGPC